MRRTWLALALLAITSPLLAQAGIKWMTDLDAALELAKEDYRLVFVEVDEGLPGNDGRFLAEAYKDPKVVAALSKFVCVRIDLGKAKLPALLEPFHVFYKPSYIILNCIGQGDHTTGSAVPLMDAFFSGAGELKTQLLKSLEFVADINGRAMEHFFPTDVEWVYTLEEAQAKARAGGTNIFVYVYLNMCAAVIDLVQEVFADPDAAEYLNGHFACLKVDLMDMGDNPALDRLRVEYQIDSVPTILILDANLEPLESWVGYDKGDQDDFADFVMDNAEK